MALAQPKTLREAYELYKQNKPSMGRQDMFGYIVTAIEELQARIGAVDEAAVAALDKRVMGLEVGIGNALTAAVKFAPMQEYKLVAGAEKKWVNVKQPKRRGRKPKTAQPPAPMNEMGV